MLTLFSPLQVSRCSPDSHYLSCCLPAQGCHQLPGFSVLNLPLPSPLNTQVLRSSSPYLGCASTRGPGVENKQTEEN